MESDAKTRALIRDLDAEALGAAAPADAAGSSASQPERRLVVVDRVALGAVVQRLRGDIGVVGPDDRAGLGVGAELAEVIEIPQRLKYPAVIEQIGEVDPRRKPVVEADADLVSMCRSGVEKERSCLHDAMVDDHGSGSIGFSFSCSLARVQLSLSSTWWHLAHSRTSLAG